MTRCCNAGNLRFPRRRSWSRSARHLETLIVTHAGLRSLDRLEATFAVTRRGRDGLRVTGEVGANVGQVCVVTLEPVDNKVSEHLAVDFLPASATEHVRTLADTVDEGDDEPPELLRDGTVDLGA